MSQPLKPLAPDIAKAFESIRVAFSQEHPLFAQLKPRAVKVGRGDIALEITPNELFVDGTSIHSGLMTILLDTVMGMATWTELDEFKPLATINLQTDTYDHAKVG
ncbi:MAG: hypothetical protein AAGG79_06970, partial [Pseudomonadota bacterium]